MPYRGPTQAVFSPGLITTPEKRAISARTVSGSPSVRGRVCMCEFVCGGKVYETREFFVCLTGTFPLLVVGRVDQIEFPTEQERVTEKSFMALVKAAR